MRRMRILGNYAYPHRRILSDAMVLGSKRPHLPSLGCSKGGLMLSTAGLVWLWDTWKVMESKNFIFQAWKVMEFMVGHWKSWKIIIIVNGRLWLQLSKQRCKNEFLSNINNFQLVEVWRTEVVNLFTFEVSYVRKYPKIRMVLKFFLRDS